MCHGTLCGSKQLGVSAVIQRQQNFDPSEITIFLVGILLLTAALAVCEVLLLWIHPLLASRCTRRVCMSNSNDGMVNGIWACCSQARLRDASAGAAVNAQHALVQSNQFTQCRYNNVTRMFPVLCSQARQGKQHESQEAHARGTCCYMHSTQLTIDRDCHTVITCYMQCLIKT